MIYTCAGCAKQFESDWADEDAREEYQKEFISREDTEVVCDDCYRKMRTHSC